jgi:tetratricopeptide (TPR) repeat protein
METDLKELYQTGKESFQKGVYPKAQECFEKFIKKNKEFADVFNMLGIIYHGQGNFTKAVESFEKALKINSKYTEAALNLSVTYNDLGQYARAKEVYSKATKAKRLESVAELQDDYARAKVANMHSELGDVYRSIGLYDEAIEEYRKALKLKPQFVDIKPSSALP